MDSIAVKCCWGLSMKRGSLITLAINMVLDFVYTGLSIALFCEDVITSTKPASGFVKFRDVFYTIANFGGIITSIMGIYAIWKNKENLLKYAIWYFYYDLVYFAFATVALLDAQPDFEKILFFRPSQELLKDRSFIEILIVFILYLCELGFAIYAMLLLNTYRLSITRPTSHGSNLSNIPTPPPPPQSVRFHPGGRQLSIISEHTTPSSSERGETDPSTPVNPCDQPIVQTPESSISSTQISAQPATKSGSTEQTADTGSMATLTSTVMLSSDPSRSFSPSTSDQGSAKGPPHIQRVRSPQEGSQVDVIIEPAAGFEDSPTSIAGKPIA